MRTVVDPRFPGMLATLVREAGISFAEVARRSHVSPGHVSDILNGKKNPSDQMARALDDALGGCGRLASLVVPAGTDEDHDRLAVAVANPRDVNPATIASLATVLAGQRRLDDTIGSAALVKPTLAELDAITRMVVAAVGPTRPDLLYVAAQYAQFCGWLHTNIGRYETAREWFARALEWAMEHGDPDLTATVLSYQGHVAWLGSQWGSTIGLSKAALRDPTAYPGQRAYDALQAGKGYAALGDLDQARSMLALGGELAHATGEWAGATPPWQYYRAPWYWSLERGIVYRTMARWDRAYAQPAVDELAAGFEGMPVEMRGADWAAEYLVHLAQAHRAVGDTAAAWDALARARRNAESTQAPRVLQMVARHEQQLSAAR
jgi:transcriptional regulator with XRE-family HTH domain